ncbi:16S rRNA (adenine(1518)-N(6)/adenine(1519)-N(6))-dimethyltransferase RsmA [Roseofilum casamattae]|uniref:Ribosomal RNA small subunit methyltransferase A n=1 Tax=Roseofilum casamattae BLCC-M143 TaxID=3022442 RepID=A0ABT7BYY9_9CYAN|nr:16S rRNA (adenine(1518)-N(6)/adenine(1519)-N(6))-dimethyltransferase RsmA [Roseofilum casamattae]MDJ1184405.1 16S rRNA (adenine(1518)-N(6)/adenine(1519)-N(6))-dimethyltransferase RsmA [Roseofilum casamattae BLCC-M143]
MHKPRKIFGQHWLTNDKILNRIVKAAELTERDRILEIGPGMGMLTRPLIQNAGKVISVEIDRDLCQKLMKNFKSKTNFLLLQGDFLSLDIDALLLAFPEFQNPNKVVANIPYNITGPILEKLLGKIAKPVIPSYEKIILLVQKEVAQRIIAKPSTKAFGALSVRVQYLAECQLLFDVPAKNFFPPPKVDSAAIEIAPRPIENPANNPQHLQQIVALGFAAKRKMLRNNFKSIISTDSLIPLLEQLNINPQARAENLSINDWVALSNLLYGISQINERDRG